jgi:hypothetical protein
MYVYILGVHFMLVIMLVIYIYRERRDNPSNIQSIFIKENKEK